MSDYDFIQFYKKLEVLDRELKELRAEVNQIKWYQQHGTTGAVAYSTQQVYTESSEHKPGRPIPFINFTEEEWSEEFK